MKLNNFELIIELREYLRDQAPTSYLTNYSLEDRQGNKANDFTEIKELLSEESSKMRKPEESGLIIKRGRHQIKFLPVNI